MPITEEQRKMRKNHLGSSDMAAILGVSPWANAYDVWLDKTDKVEEDKEKSFQSAGNMFEDGVLKWAELELGPITTEENGAAIFRKAIGFPIGSHVDGIVVSNGEPVEAKTAGLFGPLVEPWGEPGTDQLPDRIFIQGHVHMLCTDKEVCHTPVFLGGRGFVMYQINFDLDIMDTIRDRAIEFWDEYVTKDTPPPNVMPSLVFAKRMKRVTEKTIEVPTAVVQNWLNAKEVAKGANDIKEAAQSELLAAMEDAEEGTCNLGTVTYFEQVRRGIDTKRLKEDKPEVAAEYMKESKFRVVRFKKPKKPKG